VCSSQPREFLNIALGIFNLRSNCLVACNDSFVDMIEYPIAVLQNGFNWLSLHYNISGLNPTISPQVYERLLESCVGLRNCISSIAGAEVAYSSQTVQFISGTGRLKQILLDVVGIHDEQDRDVVSDMLWIGRDVNGAEIQRRHSMPTNLPSDYPSPNSPPYQSSGLHSSATPEGSLAPLTPSTQNAYTFSGREGSPPVRLLMESKTIRKNALKRPYENSTNKFTLKPP